MPKRPRKLKSIPTFRSDEEAAAEEEVAAGKGRSHADVAKRLRRLRS